MFVILCDLKPLVVEVLRRIHQLASQNEVALTNLHGLVVDERVDSDCGSFVVRRICLSPEACSDGEFKKETES